MGEGVAAADARRSGSRSFQQRLALYLVAVAHRVSLDVFPPARTG